MLKLKRVNTERKTYNFLLKQMNQKQFSKHINSNNSSGKLAGHFTVCIVGRMYIIELKIDGEKPK